MALKVVYKEHARRHIIKGHSKFHVADQECRSRFYDTDQTLRWVLDDLRSGDFVLKKKDGYHRYHIMESFAPIGDDLRKGKRIPCFHVMVVSVYTVRRDYVVVTAYPIGEGMCVFFYVRVCMDV